MSRKLTIEQMKAIAKSHGGECLSKKYSNAKTKLRWKCSEGHEWEAVPHHIKEEHWCPHCAGNAILTIEQMRKVARSRCGECLSKEYMGNHKNLRWICAEGHEWEAQPSSIKQGRWCPVCGIENSGKKRRDTIENMRIIAQSHGGKCLSDRYVDNRSKLKWRCSEGHEWDAVPSSVKGGTWCPVCAGNIPLTIEHMQKIAIERRGKCLSEAYINEQSNLRWMCLNGHKWEATPNNIKRGTWCPTCSPGVSERICRETFEHIFSKKFPKKRPKWLVNPRTGYPLELDGYCEKLGIAFEFQGQQHYQRIDFFHTSRSLEETQNIDQLKKKLCKEHGVTLIEVPSMDYDNVGSFIVSKCREYGIAIGPLSIEAFDYRSFNIYCSHDLEEMKQIAESRNGECLSKEYIHALRKLKWKCSDGHKWEATPHMIKRGTWCPVCARNIPLTIKEMHKIAKSRDGECLSDQYVNTRTKLKWRCSEGHEWEAAPSDIKSGKWCRICAGLAPLTIEEMHEIAKSRNGECLSDQYVNSQTKLKWRCSEGHKWESTPNSIKRGGWCRICAGLAPLTIEEMHKIAKSRDGECLSDKYMNSQTKLKWRCSEGHEWKAVPSSVKQGSWCPYCVGRHETIDHIYEIAKSRGGECLSNEYIDAKTNLLWKCSKGHIWEATPDNIKRGTWCPVCGIENSAGKRRDRIENMRIIAESRNGECLSDQYVNSQTKLK